MNAEPWVTAEHAAQHWLTNGCALAVQMNGKLRSTEVLQPWLKRLLEWRLVQSAGRTQATRYFVGPGLLRSLKFTGETTLKRIGGEIRPKPVKRALEELIGRRRSTHDAGNQGTPAD